MDADLRREYRDYIWKYFALHADQRLKAFHFFIVFSAILIGGFVSLVQSAGAQVVHASLPLALIFLSFLFWKLDERTKMLISNGEEALKSLDKTALGNEDQLCAILAVFAIDDRKTAALNKYPIWTGHFSYSRCFAWVYVATSLLGLVGIAICTLPEM